MNYDELYKLAFEFKKAKLWDRIDETEIFAVKLSNDRIGYVTITGAIGRVYMLAVYIGENAVQALLRMMLEVPYFFSKFEQREFMLVQNCLQCTFEDKEHLNADEIKKIKDYAKKYKYKISGKNAYPFFWKYVPYRMPEEISSEEDTEDLYECMSAAMELYRRLKNGDSKEKIGLKEVSRRTRKIIMLERTDKGYKIGKTDFPKMTVPKYPVPKCDNELAFTRLKTFENKIELECEILRIMEPLVDEDENEIPGFPVFLYVVNENSSFVLPVDPVLFYEDNPDKLMDNFLASLVKFEICPTAVKVINKQTHDFFKPFCEKLDIEMKYISEPSNFMEEFQERMENDLESDVENDDMTQEQLEELNQFLNGLLGVGQGKMSKEEFVDLLGSLGVNVTEEISDAVDYIQEYNEKEKFPDNVISLDSRRDFFDDSEEDDENMAYVISVSVYKGCYRHIKISGGSTLFKLHLAIIDAFGFDDDHLHAFFMDNKLWSERAAFFDDRADEEDFNTTSDVTLEELDLEVGKQFKYLFDFGDEWIFQCKVLKKLEEPNVKSKVIKSVGESPKQYPEYDEEDWDEDDDLDPKIFEQ